jgi:diguanylate cyclase (GGDEF)-like protein/PAS domain S-box-containing protein
MIPRRLSPRARRYCAEWVFLVTVLLGLVVSFVEAGYQTPVGGAIVGVLCLAAILGLIAYQRRQRAYDRLERSQKHALRAGEAFNRAILNSMTASVAVVDRDGVILAVNESWRHFGVENAVEGSERVPPSLVGTSYFSVCASGEGALAHDGAEARRGIEAVLNGRLASFALEYPCHSPTRRRWYLMSVTPLGQDAADGLVIAHTDVTPVKVAEEELRLAAAAFDAQEPMLVTDPARVILRVNPAFTALTGYTNAEAVGQTPRLLKSGRHSAAFYREMWDTIHSTGGWRGELWDRRKNGEEFPTWTTISAVKDASGAVTQYIASHVDISERKKAEVKIHELAFFDPLTGLPNRTLLLDRLRQSITESGRSDSYGALLFIDLDNFKYLNDAHGHEVGDLLLKQVGTRLTQHVREGDTVARLGGDDFVVILKGLGGNEREAATATEAVAAKLLAALNDVYHFSDVAHHGTASIGVVLLKGLLTSAESLMKQADLAMYKAKEAGRNTLRFFDPAMEIAVRQRTALESELRRSLAAQHFLLHYQAQVVDGGRVTGAEVLLRWEHPERGMVSPAEFIPLAEETGLILPLGQWVLETACTRLALWATQPGMEHLTLAVNVSAQQFHQDNFVSQVLAALKSTGANPRRLKLELTESLLVHNVDEIVEKMFALKARGVGFSLDDFGTGYSSLSYLKRLPLDQLKIDQSFVRDVLIDPNDAAIARTIVALANSLGLGVIAEGVETAAQRDFLAASGCHAYQGYFFSRPLAVAGFETLVKRGSQVCEAAKRAPYLVAVTPA